MANWIRQVNKTGTSGSTVTGKSGTHDVFVMCVGSTYPGSGSEGSNTGVILDSGSFPALSAASAFTLTGDNNNGTLSNVQFSIP